MCGITGFIGSVDNPGNVINAMKDSLVHRGPDSSGYWLDSDNGVALGHQRLAILDLSSEGHQPMQSPSGRYMIVFNGEIYNHLQLRAELETLEDFNQPWRGHSDTETLLAAFDLIGVEATLQKSEGMFGIAIWDKLKKTLTLSRDLMGEKPLYYGWVNQQFVFASELKAFKKFPNFRNLICKKALVNYFHLNFIPAPFSIYENIFKVTPGAIIKFDPSQATENKITHATFWSLEDSIQQSKLNLFSDPVEASVTLESTLEQSVKNQMISDVPLGAFLSGGIDSSLISALMQKNSMQPIKTFTIGFENKDYDESPNAKAVSEHLGTEHHEEIISELDIMQVIQDLPQMYDEPFGDSSQLPTHIVSKIARKNVTIALSGDAGDEIFGGYNRYTVAPRLWKSVSWIPFQFRKALGMSLLSISPNTFDQLGSLIPKLRRPQLGLKAHKMAERLKTISSLRDLLKDFPAVSANPQNLVKGMEGQNINFLKLKNWRGLDDLSDVEDMMFCDSMMYLPDDILCKVDRAAMAVSLETRVPFLNKDVIETAWRMPLSYKIDGNNGKIPLKKLLNKYVPLEITERPKSGFSIPIGEWLRGPLRAWAESLLDQSLIEKQGYLNSAPIQQLWMEHLEGNFDKAGELWGILMFQAWIDKNDPYS